MSIKNYCLFLLIRLILLDVFGKLVLVLIILNLNVLMFVDLYLLINIISGLLILAIHKGFKVSILSLRFGLILASFRLFRLLFRYNILGFGGCPLLLTLEKIIQSVIQLKLAHLNIS